MSNVGLKTVGALVKSLKEVEKTPAHKAMQQVNGLLKNAGLKMQGEVPFDQFLRNIPEAQREAVANILGNPETVQFTAKHNKNGRFSILGLIAKKGDKTVGKGALSVTNFGLPNAVAKWRFATGPKGKNLQMNGFVDCAGNATPQDVSMIAKLGKMIGLDTKVGTLGASRVKVDAGKLVKVLPEVESFDITKMPKPEVSQSTIDKLGKIIRSNIGF